MKKVFFFDILWGKIYFVGEFFFLNDIEGKNIFFDSIVKLLRLICIFLRQIRKFDLLCFNTKINMILLMFKTTRTLRSNTNLLHK